MKKNSLNLSKYISDLNSEKVGQIIEGMNAFNRNDLGEVALRQFQKVIIHLHSIGALTSKEKSHLWPMFRCIVDLDYQPTIQLKELLRYFSSTPSIKGMNFCSQIWRLLDEIKSGKVDIWQVREFMDEMQAPLSDQDIDEVFTKLDFDQDGLITVDDFVRELQRADDG